MTVKLFDILERKDLRLSVLRNFVSSRSYEMLVASVKLPVLRMEDDKMSPLSVRQAFLRMGNRKQ